MTTTWTFKPKNQTPTEVFFLIDSTYFFLIDDTYKLMIDDRIFGDWSYKTKN